MIVREINDQKDWTSIRVKDTPQARELIDLLRSYGWGCRADFPINGMMNRVILLGVKP